MFTIKPKSILALILSVASASASQTFANNAAEKPRDQIVTVPGYVVHGINNYNGEHIVDYSAVSPAVPYLHAVPPVDEIGAYQEGSAYSGTILANTNRNLPVATTRSFIDYFNPYADIASELINIPLGKVGVSFLSPEFTALDKRITPVPFPESGLEPSVYRKKGFAITPTIKEWEKMSGKLSVKKDANGFFKVQVTIRNAFPNAIYTLWDLGTLNPLTPQETGYAVPLGGLPNIVVTDNNGCGYATITMKYNLARACKAGASSCSSYVSAFYNWDNGAYGASAAATWAKAPTGIYGGNQMAWPLSGTALIEPQNDFKPKAHGCQ
jgi:hypothetical protein